MPVINQDYSENVVFSGDFARRTVTAPVAAADYVEFLDATDGQVKRCLISAISGGGGTGASGQTTVDFGAFPGGSDASVDITGQTGFDAASNVAQAWLMGVDTDDHTADEHRVETISVAVGALSTGAGFTIYAQNTSQLNEPLREQGNNQNRNALTITLGAQSPSVGGKGTRIYGKWTIGWRWS